MGRSLTKQIPLSTQSKCMDVVYSINQSIINYSLSSFTVNTAPCSLQSLVLCTRLLTGFSKVVLWRLCSYNLRTNCVASSVCLFVFTYILDSKQCYVNPCLHAGTCHEDGFGYNCTCRLGFTGSNCESMSSCHARCDFLKVVGFSTNQQQKHHNQEANNVRSELMSFRFTGPAICRDRHMPREKVYSRNSLMGVPGWKGQQLIIQGSRLAPFKVQCEPKYRRLGLWIHLDTEICGSWTSLVLCP